MSVKKIHKIHKYCETKRKSYFGEGTKTMLAQKKGIRAHKRVRLNDFFSLLPQKLKRTKRKRKGSLLSQTILGYETLLP